jgi:hypothetical protein
MGISMRQHLASLVAVFFALLIGVLVGVSLTRRPGLERKIEDLRLQVQERDELAEDRNAVATEFAERTLPVLLGNGLRGQKAAVFVTATSSARRAQGAVSDALDLAGAVVVSRATFDAHFLQHCTDDREQLRAELHLPPDAQEDMAAIVVQRVAQAATGPDGSGRRALGRRGLFRVDRLAAGRPALAIVIGGHDAAHTERLERLDLPLIQRLKAIDSIDRVVGCEMSDAMESVMRAYQREGISTIDNVDTAPGQFSLVRALAGAEGDYGMKRSAGPHVPQISEDR